MLATKNSLNNKFSLVTDDITEFCLSPLLELDVNVRPVPMLVNVTNTTATFKWEETPLPQECNGLVVSRLPLTYTIDFSLPLEGYPMVSGTPHVLL